MGVLGGINVLDLSRVFAAPLATQMLADFGATVWKVEAFHGDDSRRWGPHVFNAFNRGKLSLAVNLKDPRAQELLRRLALRADVMVENFKTGDLARYGLSYAQVNEANPGLVYASLTGFGQTGPRQSQPGYDTIVQAMTGVMTVTGHPDGPPTRVGIAWIDVMAGLVTTIGVLAAIHERSSSGLGQHLDLSLFDVGLMGLVDVAQDFLENGTVQKRAGNATRNIAPAQVFAVRDGWIVVAVGNDGQFERLCRALDCEAILADERFVTNRSRVANREVLAALLSPAFARLEREVLVGLLRKANVPGSAIFDVGEALQEPQAEARGAVWSVPTGSGTMLRMLANPLRHMSRTPATSARPPPQIGEQTGSVLRTELGLSDEEIATLERDDVVRTNQSSEGDEL